MKPILIFDIGETLLNVDESRWHPLSEIDTFQDVLHQLEKGNVEADEFIEYLQYKSGLESDEVLEKFNSIILGTWKPGMEKLLSKLVAHDVHLLSNINPCHWNEVAGILEGRFQKAFLSHELGCRKPESEIYTKVNDEIILSGNQSPIVFFDDRLENIQAARHFGWHAQQFKGAESAIKLLQSLGVKAV